MKGKVLLTLVAGIAMGVHAQQPYTPPYSEDFENGIGEFTTADANNDGKEFAKSMYNGYNYKNGLAYAGSSDSSADDWLFSPSLSLKKGYIYELTYYCKSGTSQAVNRYEWKIGKSAHVSAMTADIGSPQECVGDYSWHKQTISVSVSEDGDYTLGLHVISEAGQGTFYFDDISIAGGVSAATPVAPELGNVTTAVAGDRLHASFDIKVPTQTVGGDAIAGQITVRIMRDDRTEAEELIATAGQTLAYTDEDAALKRAVYTVTCAAGNFESASVETVANPWIGTPGAVENFKAVQNGNQFTLSWDPVTEATNAGAVFIPSAVRYNVKCGTTTVVEDFDGTSTEYTVPMPEQQEAVVFTIVAKFGTATSATSTSPSYVVGEPIKGEFRESFASGKYANSVWSVEDKSTAWQAAVYGGSTNEAYDGDGGYLKFVGSSQDGIRIYSPMLDLSELQNPKLKLWAYLDPDSYYSTSVEVFFETPAGEMPTGETIDVHAAEKAGWKEFAFDIPVEALSGTTRFLLKGKGSSSYSGGISLDNITILSYLDHNLAVEAIAPAKSFAIGQKVEFPVTVVNKGSNDESDYTVAMYANGEQIDGQVGVEVAESEETVFNFAFTALPRYAGEDVTFHFVVDLGSDGDRSDNECEFTIPVADNDLSKATGLTAQSTEPSVNLSWTAPAVSTEAVAEEVTESFESWENGSIEPQDGWVFIDADGKKQKGLNNLNNNAEFAAMVIENFTGNYSWDLSVTAYDGIKSLAMTPSYSNGAALDNWVISPVISGGNPVKFNCQTAYSYSASNTIEILWSAGGVEPSDFTVVASKIIPVGDWMECEYELPAEAKRFAIRFSGTLRGDALLFDNFHYTALTEPAVHIGYNLYRNHELIAAALPAETTSYVDIDAQDGIDHLYHVTALYDKGESAYSESATGKKGVGTAVEEIGIDADGDAEYYSLQGVRLVAPQKGEIVIVRKGTKSFKAIIR